MKTTFATRRKNNVQIVETAIPQSFYEQTGTIQLCGKNVWLIKAKLVEGIEINTSIREFSIVIHMLVPICRRVFKERPRANFPVGAN
jgi:hypothetical protein